MRLLLTGLCALALLAATPGYAQTMKVAPNGSRQTFLGPQKYFTGTVMVTMYFGATKHTRATGALVTFLPGARSAWHSHPAGQFLIVTRGVGWVQEWNGEKREIKPGDVIWTPPNVKHWHGATDKTGMSHIAIQEMVDGKNVEWMEKVTTKQYSR
jgi:quercetin dioxygenase-like cupin family protein